MIILDFNTFKQNELNPFRNKTHTITNKWAKKFRKAVKKL